MRVVVRPRELPGDARRRVLTRLATRVLRVDPADLIRAVQDAPGPSDRLVTLADEAPPDVVAYLSERWRDFPGIQLQPSYVRTYPEGETPVHVLGATGKITAETIDRYRRQGYAGDEVVGVSGIEAQYERYLRGTPGERVVEVDASGEPSGRGVIRKTLPRPGRDVELSIDGPTQRALERALARQARMSGAVAGAGVALDPATGEVLAMASLPAYDPEAFARGRRREIERVYRDRRTPALNRAIGGLYPTGSTFKVVSAAAALRAGFITPTTQLESPAEIDLYGTTFPNFEHRAHGSIDLATALEVSSDTFFYQLGDRFWRRGGRLLQDEARRFGFGAPTGIDIEGESPGVVPDLAYKRKAFHDSPDPLDRTWKAGDTINLSVGQGLFLATPLQLARAYAALANGGTAAAPSLGRAVRDPTGRVVVRLSQGRPARPLGASAETMAVLRQGLLQAANDADGTSVGVFGGLPARFRVAGKTGTAEPGSGGGDHSWYVGYAPASKPRIVVAVVIEHGGTGANAAAPVVCRTIAAGLRFSPDLCGGATAAVAN